MTLSSRVAQNYIIQLAGKIIATILGLVATALITRYLGTAGFGDYTVILTFISFFAILADLGLTLVTVQMISRPGVNEERVLSNLMGLRLVSAVLFLGLAPLAVWFFPYAGAVKIGVLLAALSFFFIAMSQVLVGLFQKNLALSRVSIAEILNRVVLVLLIFWFIKMDWGLLSLIWAMVIASGVNFLLLYFYSREFHFIRLRFERIVWQDIFEKAWPLALTIAFNLIYLKTDTLILSLAKTQAEVGLYGAAYRALDVLITLPFIFAGIVLPIMTKRWAEKNREKFKETLQKSFDAMAIVALPMMAGVQFIAAPAIELIAGFEFIQSGRILQVLIVAAGAIFLQVVFSHAIIAIDKQKKIIGAYVFTAITALAGYFIFIPNYSYFGAAWVTVYSEIIIGLASVYLVWRYTEFFPSFAIFFKSLIATGVMAIALYLLQSYNLILLIFAGGTIYFACLALIGGLKFIPIREILAKQKKAT